MSRSCSSTGWCAAHGAIRKGFNFPQTVQFNPSAILPEILPMSGRANWGFVFALVAAVVDVVPDVEDAEGL